MRDDVAKQNEFLGLVGQLTPREEPQQSFIGDLSKSIRNFNPLNSTPNDSLFSPEVQEITERSAPELRPELTQGQELGIDVGRQALGLAAGLETLNQQAQDRAANITLQGDVQSRISREGFEQSMEQQELNFIQSKELQNQRAQQQLTQLADRYGLQSEVLTRNAQLQESARLTNEIDTLLAVNRRVNAQERPATQQFFRDPVSGAEI